jgi:hypothetical protein
MFIDIPNNQSTIIVLQKGLPNEQFTLNNNNQQQIHLELIDGNWQQVNSKKINFNYWLVMIVFSLVFLGSFIVFKKRFNKAFK